MVTKGDLLGGVRGRLRVWDGNVLKLGCDGGCTTINIIKFIQLKNKIVMPAKFSLEKIPARICIWMNKSISCL